MVAWADRAELTRNGRYKRCAARGARGRTARPRRGRRRRRGRVGVACHRHATPWSERPPTYGTAVRQGNRTHALRASATSAAVPFATPVFLLRQVLVTAGLHELFDFVFVAGVRSCATAMQSMQRYTHGSRCEVTGATCSPVSPGPASGHFLMSSGLTLLPARGGRSFRGDFHCSTLRARRAPSLQPPWFVVLHTSYAGSPMRCVCAQRPSDTHTPCITLDQCV